MRSVKYIHDLRKQIKNTYFVGLLGPQNNGKTSALHLALGISDQENLPGDSPTRSPHGYPLGTSGHIHVIDFPAFNDERSDNKIQQEMTLPFLMSMRSF